MTVADQASPPNNRRLVRAGVLTGAALAVATGAAVLPGLLADVFGPLHVRPTPDWSPIADAGPVIQIHLAAALVALGVGAWLVWGPKGRRWHRRLGWLCAGLLMVTALSSFGIRSMTGHYSWIHGLSAWTVLALPFGVMAARRHKVAWHRRTMTGLFWGGLVIAGLFAFMPGRRLFMVFFGFGA